MSNSPDKSILLKTFKISMQPIEKSQKITHFVMEDMTLSKQAIEKNFHRDKFAKAIIDTTANYAQMSKTVNEAELNGSIIARLRVTHNLSHYVLEDDQSRIVFFYYPTEELKIKENSIIDKTHLTNIYMFTKDFTFFYKDHRGAKTLRTARINAFRPEYFVATDRHGNIRSFRYDSIIHMWTAWSNGNPHRNTFKQCSLILRTNKRGRDLIDVVGSSSNQYKFS